MDASEAKKQFGREYPRLFGAVYRYVRYRVPHAEDAEDVTADCLLAALAKLDRYDPAQGSLSQWLAGFARHAVLTYWRSRRPVAGLDELAEAAVAACGSPDERLDARLLADRLMRGLPPEAKALLAMRHVDGLTHAEIAEALGRDPASVRQFFSRLHRQLRLSAPDESSSL